MCYSFPSLNVLCSSVRLFEYKSNLYIRDHGIVVIETNKIPVQHLLDGQMSILGCCHIGWILFVWGSSSFVFILRFHYITIISCFWCFVFLWCHFCFFSLSPHFLYYFSVYWMTLSFSFFVIFFWCMQQKQIYKNCDN